MKRTSFRPPVLKERKCKACKQSFMQSRHGQTVCDGSCAALLVNQKKVKEAKKEQAEDQRQTRAQLEQLKAIGQLEEECRKIIQKIARIRDRSDGCISCHVGPNYGGRWNGSHYRAHGGCSSLQMHLWNVHKSCAQCNLFKGGNKEGFIRGLLVKPGYGPDRLAWLDCQPKSKKFSRDYLARFKKVMGRRANRLERKANVL